LPLATLLKQLIVNLAQLAYRNAPVTASWQAMRKTVISVLAVNVPIFRSNPVPISIVVVLGIG
jgi:hypothetical protein